MLYDSFHPNIEVVGIATDDDTATEIVMNVIFPFRSQSSFISFGSTNAVRFFDFLT